MQDSQVEVLIHACNVLKEALLVQAYLNKAVDNGEVQRVVEKLDLVESKMTKLSTKLVMLKSPCGFLGGIGCGVLR